jgi:hypothetical protein
MPRGPTIDAAAGIPPPACRRARSILGRDASPPTDPDRFRFFPFGFSPTRTSNRSRRCR